MIITPKEYLKLFSSHSTDKKTKIMHLVGILFLVLSSLMLLSFVVVGIPNIWVFHLADLVVIGLLFLYFKLHSRMALICVPVLLIILMIADLMTSNGLQVWSLVLTIVLFCIGLGLNYFALSKVKDYPKINVNYVLFLPFWMTAEVIFTLGYMSKAKEQLS